MSAPTRTTPYPVRLYLPVLAFRARAAWCRRAESPPGRNGLRSVQVRVSYGVLEILRYAHIVPMSYGRMTTPSTRLVFIVWRDRTGRLSADSGCCVYSLGDRMEMMHVERG